MPVFSHAMEWSLIPTPTTADLRGLWGSGDDSIYAAGGYDTTIIYYNGRIWTDIEHQLPPLATADTHAIWGTSPDNIYSAGGWSYWGLKKGNILHYNGQTWRSVTANPNSFLAWTNDLRSIWGPSAESIYAVGLRNYVLTRMEWTGPVLHYDGTSVTEMPNPREDTDGAVLYDIWGTGDTDIFAAGTVIDEICIEKKRTCTFFGLLCWDECIAYQQYNHSNIMHYDGSEWACIETGVNADLYSLWGSSATDVFAVGRSGTVLHYDGASWNRMSSPSGNHLYAVWGTSPENVFAAGAHGTIMHYNGSVWSLMQSPAPNKISSLWGASSNRIYAAGDNGTILLYAQKKDYGDAPDPPYPSSYAAGGASHSSCNTVWLGDRADTEPDALQINPDRGDDGVIFIGSSSAPGGPYSLPYQPGSYGAVTVTVNGSSDNTCYLHGWIDWNSDGDWDDAHETIICGYSCAAPGQYTVEFTVPDTITDSCTWARFRVDLDENICSPTGSASHGEVEDYRFCPTLVELSSFTAMGADGCVFLSWTTASEINNTGFNIHRSESENGHMIKINESLIPSRGGADQGAHYSYTDHDVVNGKTYFYLLEDIDTDGRSTLHGSVSAVPAGGAISCYAMDSVSIDAGQPAYTYDGSQLRSCYADMIVSNTGSRDIMVWWYSTDTYTRESVWEQAFVPAGDTCTVEKAWGTIYLNYGKTRDITAEAVTAYYFDGEYKEQCSGIAQELESADSLDVSIDHAPVEDSNPCR